MGVVEVGKSEAKGTGGPAYGTLVYDQEMSEIRPREVQNFLYAGDGGARRDADDTASPSTTMSTRPPIPSPIRCSRPSCWPRGGAATARGTGISRKATITTASR